MTTKMCPACKFAARLPGADPNVNAHEPESPGFLQWWREENSRVMQLTDAGWVPAPPALIIELELGVNDCTNGRSGWASRKLGIYVLPHVH